MTWFFNLFCVAQLNLIMWAHHFCFTLHESGPHTKRGLTCGRLAVKIDQTIRIKQEQKFELVPLEENMFLLFILLFFFLFFYQLSTLLDSGTDGSLHFFCVEQQKYEREENIIIWNIMQTAAATQAKPLYKGADGELQGINLLTDKWALFRWFMFSFKKLTVAFSPFSFSVFSDDRCKTYKIRSFVVFPCATGNTFFSLAVIILGLLYGFWCRNRKKGLLSNT